MKKSFPQRSRPFPRAIGLILGLLVLLFALRAGDSLEIRGRARDSFSPLYNAALYLKNSFSFFSGFFSSKGSFINKIQNLEDELARARFENSSLGARVHDLEGLLSLAPQAKMNTTSALVTSQAPSTPYDTLRVSWDSSKKISPGTKVLAFGGAYLGEVTETGEKTALVKLISYPGLETEAWLSRLSLNVTLIGQGGYNLKLTLPKSIRVEVGDKVFSNTDPQLLIGEVMRVEGKASEPLQDIIFRFPFNFKNLRYVEFIN
ncbi:hypothetical protein HYT00_01655 [Candidatus Giovannonibacteria bacterium]|nr:hypothetical protein [Candidatus Giovannonibacteria bacterium]